MNNEPTSQTTERSAPVAKTWQPIDTVPWDRYVFCSATRTLFGGTVIWKSASGLEPLQNMDASGPQAARMADLK